ncbi:MAG: C45 family autoproteolytic acyltransferase/hydrolase, partial [Desulfosarcinaceae bacterium]
MDIPFLKVGGTPYEIGLAHGKALKDLIAGFVSSIASVHQANNPYLKARHEDMMAVCMRNAGFLEKFSEALVEEMRGIADGAGVPFEEIVYLNSFLELEDVRAPGLGARLVPDTLWGCTTFNVTAEAGADGKAYIGQTFDMEKYYKKYLVLLSISPQNGPDMLVLTFAGVLGLVGLNAAGLAVVVNKIVATDARPGVIYPFILRKALSAERIGDALGAVIFSPRAAGMNYQLADSGVAFCAETSAGCYQLLPFEKAIAHTNHYVGGDMSRFETPNWLGHGGSMVRKQIADRFLSAHSGQLT